jgi:hypothetical protein
MHTTPYPKLHVIPGDPTVTCTHCGATLRASQIFSHSCGRRR